jgi:hypothetical protein
MSLSMDCCKPSPTRKTYQYFPYTSSFQSKPNAIRDRMLGYGHGIVETYFHAHYTLTLQDGDAMGAESPSRATAGVVFCPCRVCVVRWVPIVLAT